MKNMMVIISLYPISITYIILIGYFIVYIDVLKATHDAILTS